MKIEVKLNVVLPFLLTCLSVEAVASGLGKGNKFLFEAGKVITGKALDGLIVDGIKHIANNGEAFCASAGSGLQAYDTTYVLLNPRNRLHLLRKPKSTQYLCRELIAYFNGSLKVKDGLFQASKFWKKLADKEGNINSNYGYYVFHQPVPQFANKKQYDWALENLLKSLDSRKAFINVNQPCHKNWKSKDFPCTIGMQFFVRKNALCCVVSSRSTDIFTGLPYDMGFFSLVHELVYRDLKMKLPVEDAKKLQLGYTSMKTNFTQIYDKTKKEALDLVKNLPENFSEKLGESKVEQMPAIDDAQAFRNDIYNKTNKTKTMKWIYDQSKF